MDRIKNSHYFVVALGIALVLNIFVNLTTSLLQKHVSLAINPGDLTYAILWSFAMGVAVAALVAYMNGVFVAAKATEWADKKTVALERTFYAFFITTTVFLLLNLFGKEKFDQVRNATALIAGIIFLGNLLLPDIMLYINKFGDTHNENVTEKLAAPKAPVKKGSKKKVVDEKSNLSFWKVILIVGIIFLLIRISGCGGNASNPGASDWSGINGNNQPINQQQPNAPAGSAVDQPPNIPNI